MKWQIETLIFRSKAFLLRNQPIIIFRNRYPLALWLFNIAMEAMAHLFQWFTELKNGDVPWRTVSHNQMDLMEY